jgi:hypothetical protein
MSQHPDPIDALHGSLLAAPGGMTAGAKAIGRSAGVIHNKFSDGMPHYEVTAREALALAKWSGSPAYVEAVCAYFGGVFLPVAAGKAGDDDVLQSYLDIIARMGELSREFTEARADGVIDPDEFQTLKVRANRTVQAIMHMVADIETLVRDLPSPPPVLKKAVG